ncbi:unnamed protein product [Adineta ricciae]|uniref:Iminophenyl-pyruvate dimer synthase domain-containing protein n=3 Tax=Adineta ricciae TaxID=249248 RepID=A0A815C4B8_ADIRI|nr:unnamed protein product [Adineta ricciae]
MDDKSNNDAATENDQSGEKFSEYEKRDLVERLHLASKLEHCLLNAYIYTACTIKSTPEEFVDADQENKRYAIQFERAREWKKSIFMVAHEEMLHLHYVQCLLRALGEKPYFQLPDKKPGTNVWFIPNWDIKNGKLSMNNGDGTIIPIESCTFENAQRFVLYESSDSLQDMGAISEKAKELYGKLFDFEIRLRIEQMLIHIKDKDVHDDLAKKLYNVYTQLPVSDKPQTPFIPMTVIAPLKPESFQFQSIGDFYHHEIQPLYDMAFDKQWTRQTNFDLVAEQKDPNVAAEGFLPLTPNYRYKNFPDMSKGGMKSHCNKKKSAHCEYDIPGWFKNKEDVHKIINEIVDEGEGFDQFYERAEQLLNYVAKIGGAGAYLQQIIQDQDKTNPSKTPEELKDGQLVRESHLYRFAIIMTAFQQEKDFAARAGISYEVKRTPVNIDGNTQLDNLCQELPGYFNACFVPMIMWLSRMYEIKDWSADKPRRQAIEMLAAWPIMSLGIRPFLELASFFKIDQSKLFSLADVDLPSSLTDALELLKLYNNDDRSEEIYTQMDDLALNTLEAVGAWAENSREFVKTLQIPEHTKTMILTRLTGLIVLKEFKLQFEFRMHGGYSNKSPDANYELRYCDSHTYEEDPNLGDDSGQTKIYNDALLLRLRFSGWGQVQLATDPDPPTDESGCSGTHMLHATDGKSVFNRALVWQKHNGSNEIIREPAKDLPTVGVNCIDVSLMASGTNMTVGYVPLSEMQSLGAVQASGTQFDLDISGVHELLRCTPKDILQQPDKQIRIDLLDKDGKKPLLLGENHLVWKDGEPIDPFILSVGCDTADQTTAVEFEREVFNDTNVSMLRMTPLERLFSQRGPVGFDSTANIPTWAKCNFLKDPEKSMVANDYLEDRAKHLCDAMKVKLDKTLDQLTVKDATEIISYAERMNLVSFPRPTTKAWLNATLHYGHTISGTLKLGGNSLILKTIQEKTGLSCSLVDDPNRKTSNSRWLAKYTLGAMDTDALSNFIFGELYMPLKVTKSDKEIQFVKTWVYTNSLFQTIAEFACRFDKPFWNSDYQIVDNQTRTLIVEDGNDKINLTETCTNANGAGYEYTQDGFKGVQNCRQYSRVEDYLKDKMKLSWGITFKIENIDALMQMVNFFNNQTDAINHELQKYFTPAVIDQ